MASIEAAIEARALAFAGLTALIGQAPVRLYPPLVYQGSGLPYVLYTLVTDPPFHVMGADQDSQARVQFDVFAGNWASARAVRDQLLLCFDRLTGSFGGTTIDRAVCENRGQQIDPDEPSKLPRLVVEFQMTYRL